MNDKLLGLKIELAVYLGLIGDMLPEGLKLTLIGRDPDNPENSLVMSNDDLDKVIEQIRLLQDREAV